MSVGTPKNFGSLFIDFYVRCAAFYLAFVNYTPVFLWYFEYKSLILKQNNIFCLVMSKSKVRCHTRTCHNEKARAA